MFSSSLIAKQVLPYFIFLVGILSVYVAKKYKYYKIIRWIILLLIAIELLLFAFSIK